MKKITITTRKSILAQWQANEVARQIKALSPDTEVEVMGLSTEGDRRQDVSLSTLGGKGVFVKELERLRQQVLVAFVGCARSAQLGEVVHA